MWLILLDSSSSMGEPFSGDQRFSGRTTVTESTTKLQAAVETILERIAGRNPDEAIVITFTTRATRLVDGTAAQQERFRKALASVEANGGTDIGAALDEAAACIDEGPHDGFHTVLLVTDGKSDPGPARDARHRLVPKVVQLSAVLIDHRSCGGPAARAALQR